jgi:hypothetical protein
MYRLPGDVGGTDRRANRGRALRRSGDASLSEQDRVVWCRPPWAVLRSVRCPAGPSIRLIRGMRPGCRRSAVQRRYIGSTSSGFRWCSQAPIPFYHLDSDPETAITGDLATLRRRRVLRLLLNLSTRAERNSRYLVVDRWSVDFDVEVHICAVRSLPRFVVTRG